MRWSLGTHANELATKTAAYKLVGVKKSEGSRMWFTKDEGAKYRNTFTMLSYIPKE